MQSVFSFNIGPALHHSCVETTAWHKNAFFLLDFWKSSHQTPKMCTSRPLHYLHILPCNYPVSTDSRLLRNPPTELLSSHRKSTVNRGKRWKTHKWSIRSPTSYSHWWKQFSVVRQYFVGGMNVYNNSTMNLSLINLNRRFDCNLKTLIPEVNDQVFPCLESVWVFFYKILNILFEDRSCYYVEISKFYRSFS